MTFAGVLSLKTASSGEVWIWTALSREGAAEARGRSRERRKGVKSMAKKGRRVGVGRRKESTEVAVQ